MTETRSISVNTGDILLGNWITVLGRLANITEQRWGHAAIIVNIDGTPYAFDISISSGKPTLTPLVDYMLDPTLKDLVVRQLRTRLSASAEAEFQNAIVAHDHVHYPSLGNALKRLTGQKTTSSNELLCSELVYSVLRYAALIPSTQPTSIIMPDSFLPGKISSLDAIYEQSYKTIVRRNIPTAQMQAMLEPQLRVLGHYLAQ